MKYAFKQAVSATLLTVLLAAPSALFAENVARCELGKTCKLGLASKAIFPIRESGTYLCEVNYFGTQIALQDQEAVLQPGLYTEFTPTQLDIAGDKATQVNITLDGIHDGEIVIKSSDYTLYYDAVALCSKA